MAKKNNNNLLYVIGAAGLATAGAILYLGRKAGAEEDPPVCPVGQRWDGSKCVPIIVPIGSIELSSEVNEAEVGVEVPFTAVVRDVNDNLMSGIRLHLFSNSSHMEHLSITNSNGVLKFTIVFDEEGTYSIFVSNNQDGS